MRSREAYLEGINRLRPNLYLGGVKVEPPILNHPQIRAHAEVLASTFEGPEDPELSELATATSHLTGERINRFTHIHQSREDLYAKVVMTRRYCQRLGVPCIMRCMGCDALNALYVVTYEVDKAYGTEYHKRFTEFLRRFQAEDLVGAAAMTDVKGDRGLRPSQQADPDMYLHVVERREDGIVVRGAKHHITTATVADELIILPTREMGEGEADYAVAFATPPDTEGITLIARPTARRVKREIESPISSKYGSVEPLIVFDDVFIPWERVFLCGEWRFTYPLVEAFATFHRHSYSGCKAALGDLLLGAAALMAEYNGVSRASHVREKLAELACGAEIAYACGIAASYHAKQTPSGAFYPDVSLVNVGKHYSGTHVYEEYRRVHDIAGGIACDVPSEADYRHPEVGRWIAKYMRGSAGVPSDHRIRLAHYIEDLTVQPWGGFWLVASLHGGGSPAAELITLLNSYDIEGRKERVKRILGIQ